MGAKAGDDQIAGSAGDDTGRPLHLPDGVVVSTDDRGKQWRTAVEVELTRKTRGGSWPSCAI